jgi:hypothetical protein
LHVRGAEKNLESENENKLRSNEENSGCFERKNFEAVEDYFDFETKLFVKN